MDVTIFGLNLTLNPVAFTIPIAGGWNVYWYGIIIACGFMLAVVYGILNAKRVGINGDHLLDAVIFVTPAAILGARLYYIVFDKDMTLKDFFNFSNGGFSGLAIYGGVIAAFLTGALMCRILKINMLDAFDLTAVGFLIGQGIGRWGNFINQEAFGAATGSSWFGMTSENVAEELGEGVLAHPCFLYESVWCLVGAYLLHRYSKNRLFKGQVVLGYCVWYGFGRAIIELFRTDSLMLGAIRVSSLLSALLCIAGVVATVVIRRKINKPETEQYVPVFADEMEESEEL